MSKNQVNQTNQVTKSTEKTLRFEIWQEEHPDFLSYVLRDKKVDMENYNIVECALMAECENVKRPTSDALERVFYIYNAKIPQGFRGHSLSVGDVVKIVYAGKAKPGTYYCDSMGFVSLDDGSYVNY